MDERRIEEGERKRACEGGELKKQLLNIIVFVISSTLRLFSSYIATIILHFQCCLFCNFVHL